MLHSTVYKAVLDYLQLSENLLNLKKDLFDNFGLTGYFKSSTCLVMMQTNWPFLECLTTSSGSIVLGTKP